MGGSEPILTLFEFRNPYGKWTVPKCVRTELYFESVVISAWLLLNLDHHRYAWVERVFQGSPTGQGGSLTPVVKGPAVEKESLQWGLFVHRREGGHSEVLD